jgi:hypothetical protein
MGYIPFFIVMGGVLLLWGMTAYYTLENRLQEVRKLAKNLQDATQEQQKEHQIALRMYNATVADGAAKFWAMIFGYKKLNA